MEENRLRKPEKRNKIAGEELPEPVADVATCRIALACVVTRY
jgi:hypothetical protein